MTVSLDLAKQHCRIDGNDEDSLVGAYLAAAKAWVEGYTGKKLARGTVTQEVDRFGCYVPLFWGPDAQDVSLAYTDTDGAPQTITDARLVSGKVYAPTLGWPAIADASGIIATYSAGFDETPADLDAAVLLLVGDFYANREAGTATAATTMAVEALCRPYRALYV